MFQHHKELRDLVIKVNDAVTNDVILRTAGERRVEKLVKQLAEFEAVTKRIYRDNATVHSARAYVNTVLEDYPNLSDRLEANASSRRKSRCLECF